MYSLEFSLTCEDGSTRLIGRQLEDHGARVASAGRFRRGTAHATIIAGSKLHGGNTI